MRQIAMIAALLALVPLPAVSQESAMTGLVTRARAALNDLQFDRAESLATAALRVEGTRSQRVDALSIAAASRYPEPASGGRQQPDASLAYLRDIIRTEPLTRRLRAEVSWPGLDSLFAVARASVFAVLLRTRGEQVATGAQGRVSLDVTASRRVSWKVAFVAASGAAVVLDSAGGADSAVLRFTPLTGRNAAVLRTGDYTVRISATDSAGEAITIDHPATVRASTVELVTVPSSVDSARLRPEARRPARLRGVLAGLFLGGVAAAGATVRGPNALGSADADVPGYVIGGVMTVGALIGGLLDRGYPLRDNIAANERVRAAFAESVRNARAENQRRLDAFRFSLTIAEAQ